MNHIVLAWRPLSIREANFLATKMIPTITFQFETSPCYSGASAGFSGAGSAGAGAGASAGCASSLTAGCSGALALHPIPMEAKLITKTKASRKKTHLFKSLHLLSDGHGNSPLFSLPKESSLHREMKSLVYVFLISLDRQVS